MLLFALISVTFYSVSAMCPQGSLQGSSASDCYLYLPPDTWLNALEDCSSRGGHLVSIPNAFVNAFLPLPPKRTCSNPYCNDIHKYWVGASVGFRRQTGLGATGAIFRTLTGLRAVSSKSTNYYAYGNSMLFNLDDEHWYAHDCLSTLPYICKVPPAPSSAPAPTQCPSGWTSLSSSKKCYKSLLATSSSGPTSTASTLAVLSSPQCFLRAARTLTKLFSRTVREKLPGGLEPRFQLPFPAQHSADSLVFDVIFVEALAQCQSYGASLASIHDAETNALLTEMVSVHNNVNCSNGYINALLGLNATQARRWQWADGSPFDWSNWAPGEPNNFQDEQYCARLMNECGSYTTMWDDIGCSFTFRTAICQLEPTK